MADAHETIFLYLAHLLSFPVRRSQTARLVGFV